MNNLIKFTIVFIFSIAYFQFVIYLQKNGLSASLEKNNEVSKIQESGNVLGVNEIAIKQNKIQKEEKINKEIKENSINNTIFYNFPEIAYKKIAPTKKNTIDTKLEILSPIAFAIDKESSLVLFEKDAEKIVSIASITKLVTALVFLDLNPDWDKSYEIKVDDRIDGGKIFLYKGDIVKIKDLFHLSLVASDNTATKALVSVSGLSEKDFIEMMNKKVLDFGLTNTKFSDFVGLNNENKSTAKDLAEIAKIAFSKNEIKTVLSKKDYSFTTEQGKVKKVFSTNELLGENENPKNLGGKTGFTESALYCFVGLFTNSQGNEIISIVLGANDIYARFEESEKVAKFVYDVYEW